jgi:hypothetical protein
MADIKIACPQCQQRLSVGPEYFGLHVPCPVCQTILLIPHPELLDTVPTSTVASTHSKEFPRSVKFLAYYYAVLAIPFIAFSLFGFTIPAEELTNHPEYLDRDRGFITGMKMLMFGGLLLYSLAHLVSAIQLLRGKSRGYRIACVLSNLGMFHFNPFAIPGLMICKRQNVQDFFAQR